MSLDRAAELIKRFEGKRNHAYPDPATHGPPWTVGYGCTGYGIGPDTYWDDARCDAELVHRLESLAAVVEPLIHVPLSESQLGAVLSLGWNIGSHALAESTVLKRLNVGDYDGAARAFLLWDKAAGAVNAGLVKRRHEEMEAFLEDSRRTTT